MFQQQNNDFLNQRVLFPTTYRASINASGRRSPADFLDCCNDVSKGKRSPALMDDLYGDTDTEDSLDFISRSHSSDFAKLSCSSCSSMDEIFTTDQHGSHQSQQNQFKCRQLPCRTFISTGSCPYGDRCVFLHDPCIVAKPVYIKTKRKSKDDTATDNFFWPTMSLNSVMTKVDNKNSKFLCFNTLTSALSM